MKPAKPPAKRPAPKTPTWPGVCVCVFLALAVLAVFGQTAEFGFVNYDDNFNVYDNPVVAQGLTLKTAGWAFTHAQVSNWIPLTTLSHELDCQMFGLQAGGHHLVNVCFHAANAVLLFLVLRRMTRSLWRSAFVAAVFAVHPLRAESVAWVSERKDVLSAFFFLLAIGAYVEKWKAESRKQKLCYALVVVFFVLGLLAKSMVATLPFVLLLLDYWPLGRLQQGAQFLRLVKEKIPLFVLAAGSCVATALAPGLIVTHAGRLPLLERAGNALVSYAVYLGQMLYPAGFACLYPIPPKGCEGWQVCLACVVLAAITAGVVVWRKTRPCLLLGWLWYLGMLFPVSGIIQISAEATHADRYTYLPGIGLVVAVAWAVADASAGWKNRRLVLGGLMAAVIGTLAVCGYRQTAYWKDSETLWKRALDCTSGNNFVARNNLGNIHYVKGDMAAAIKQFQEVLAITPDNAKVRCNLGNALYAQGDREGAIAQYRKALEIEPDFAMALSNLGNALFEKGDWDGAIAQYEKSLAVRPSHAPTRHNLVLALLRKGDLDEALACCAQTAPLSSDPLARWNNLGNDLLRQHELEEAIICYRQALKINPSSADSYANLGLACIQKGQTKGALDCWEKSLALKPGQLSVQNNLAWALATTCDDSLRNGAKALALATQANRASGDGDLIVLRTLAAACAETGNFEQAAITARRALDLAQAQKNGALAAELQKEILLYQANTPMRDTSR